MARACKTVTLDCTVDPGIKLGPYEIKEPLGKGGMGEVYRARDTKLDRDVAIKVLPAELADDPERLARLEREARLLASLNHPNVGSIYGLEETDESRPALVLELVEGPTLADRIRTGPVPVEEALGIALQIAEALEVAHQRGIIHRDLKPANVKVTGDGMVKVLDFGLAKAVEGEQSEQEQSDSPTLSAVATEAGIILGTAGYMSPEQARGKEVDWRADIWSFGVVLMEMLTGERVFEGETVSETLAAVIKDDADLQELPPETPVRVRDLLQRCLEKDFRQRLQAVGEARIVLQAVLAEPEPATLAADSVPSDPGRAPEATSARRGVSPWVALGLALAVGVVAGVAAWLGSRPEPRSEPVHRFRVAAPGIDLARDAGNNVVGISPDGQRLVYLARERDRQVMMQRLRDELEASPIPGADLASFFPRFSPDGRWLLVSNDDGMYRVPVSGGEPFRLSGAAPSVFAMGDWADNDTVIYSDGRALWRVDAAGGQSELLSELPTDGNAIYYLTDLLPGGRYALLDRERGRRVDVVVAAVETGEIVTVVAEGVSTASFVPSGHVVFARAWALEAVAFDPDAARVLGTPVPVVDGVHVDPVIGVAAYAVSDTGTLVYAPADPSSARFSLVWVDRDGAETLIRTFEEAWPARPRVSPDGRRVAAESKGAAAGGSGIRVWDLERGGSIQLTPEGMKYDPVWMPDGERIVFSSVEDGVETLLSRRADGLGPAEPIPHIDRNENAYSFSPDGVELATYGQESNQGDRDIFVRSVGDGWERRPILATGFNERSPAFSPDGRWLAYASDESGQDEVYVIRYPEIDRKYSISTDGGREPAWSPDGTELYYRRDDEIFAVSIRTEPRFRADRPVRLFGGPYRGEFHASGSRSYDVSPDGRFLMVRSDTLTEPSPGELVVVLNWTEELKRRVPGSD